VITTLDVTDTVGTFYARILSAATLGHALLVAGFLCWVFSRTRFSLGATLTSLLLSLAILAAVKLQTINSDVWLSQLRFVAALDRYAPGLGSNTMVALLDVPNSPYDARYYALYTRIAQLLYDDNSLKVAPWLEKLPAEEQLSVFGEDSLVAVRIIHPNELPTVEAPYERVIVLQYVDSATVEPVTTITDPYLIPVDKTWFVDRTLAVRQQPFELPAPADWPARSDPPGSSHGRDSLLEYCRKLLDACRD
jgi:hypothetical protein